MFAADFVLAAALAALSVPGMETGTQLTYTGSMTAVKDDGNPAVKKFQLSLLVLADEGNAAQVAWTLEETGRGGWTWLDRFGRWPVAADRRDDGQTGPALLYERADGKSVVPLTSPLFSADAKLEKGTTWLEGRMEYKVIGETQARSAGEGTAARPACWEIEARTPYGHKRTLWVAKDSPLVVAVRETVFIGQGQEHKLVLELTNSKSLPASEVDKAATTLDGWIALRGNLGWPQRNSRTELSDEQLTRLKTDLPKLAESAASGPLANIAQAAQKDSQSQKNRAGAVAALRAAAVGQPLGDMALADLADKPFDAAALKGKVVVLHFWEYRDAPLEEPYGQVGYLDFLTRRRPEAVVLGVNVDERLTDPETRKAALASARRLKAFMNLSYPILADNGELLKRLGDPRPAGGKLPLFVVIGADGKITEYRAGLYEVQANAGLAELDAVVGKALGGN